MTRMNLLLRLAVLPVLCAALFRLDDMKPVPGLDHIADLSGLERESSVLKLLHHLPAPEPSKVAAFIFAARIGRELFGERCKIFAAARALQDIFRLSPRLARIELRVLGDV